MGRVVIRSGRRICVFRFNNREELKKVLDAVALVAADNVDVAVLLERDHELNELTSTLNSSLKVVKVTLKPTGAQVAATTAEPRNPEFDEEKVYEVVKGAVDEKLKRGEQYLLFRELHVKLFGRELNLRDWRDDKLARKLRKALESALKRVGDELGVKFEETTIREYNGRTGRFKAYRIVPAAKSR